MPRTLSGQSDSEATGTSIGSTQLEWNRYYDDFQFFSLKIGWAKIYVSWDESIGKWMMEVSRGYPAPKFTLLSDNSGRKCADALNQATTEVFDMLLKGEL